MTEQAKPETVSPQNNPPIIIDSTPASEDHGIREAETLSFLKEMQENVGQMSELVKEEENVVKEFFNLLAQILKAFSKTLEISPSTLPAEYVGRINKACLNTAGELVLVYLNGQVEVLSLKEQENYETLNHIAGEIMMKLRVLIVSYKSDAERRVRFLMAITRELQKIAKVFTEQ